MARSGQLVRQLRVLGRLLNGQPRRLRDFADIYRGFHTKTLLRDLQAWAQVPEAKVQMGSDSRGRWFRCDLNAVPDGYENHFKVCNKCPDQGLQPMSNFGKVSRSPDGHRGICKTCMNRARREWYGQNSEAANRYRRRNYRSSRRSKKRDRDV